jgi:hypothetical protein
LKEPGTRHAEWPEIQGSEITPILAPVSPVRIIKTGSFSAREDGILTSGKKEEIEKASSQGDLVNIYC